MEWRGVHVPATPFGSPGRCSRRPAPQCSGQGEKEAGLWGSTLHSWEAGCSPTCSHFSLGEKPWDEEASRRGVALPWGTGVMGTCPSLSPVCRSGIVFPPRWCAGVSQLHSWASTGSLTLGRLSESMCFGGKDGRKLLFHYFDDVTHCLLNRPLKESC